MQCPECSSTRVQRSDIGKKIGCGIGAVAGGVTGIISTGEGVVAGAAIGSAIMPGVGTIAGGVLGLLIGMGSGAVIGGLAGEAIDDHLFNTYHCDSCGCQFEG